MSNDNCVSITTAFNHNCSITTAFNHTAATPLTLRALAGVNDRTHPASTASTLGDIAIQASAIRGRAAPMIVLTRRISGILLAKRTNRMMAITSRLLCGAVFPLGAPVTTRSWTG